MANIFHWLITHIAPIFIISSPITSYADQIHSIHRTRTSAGFSLDIPLIMLTASILKLFYWLSAHYDVSLLFQAILMVAVHLLLLHVALSNRPPPPTTPFAAADHPKALLYDGGVKRPWAFWQWRSAKPYWLFLAYYTVTLLALQLLFRTPNAYYSTLQGYVALAIEALLPIPQLFANFRRQSCVGFRLSVLANWLVGDAFKMTFFFLKDSDAVPWAFKACGLFQAGCDVLLGVQYALYGNRSDVVGLTEKAIPAWEEKEVEMARVPVGRPMG